MLLQRACRAEVVLTNVAGDVILRFGVGADDWSQCLRNAKIRPVRAEMYGVGSPTKRPADREVLDDVVFSLLRLVRQRLSKMAPAYHEALFTIIKERMEEKIRSLQQQAEEHDDQAVHNKQNQQQSSREEDPQQTQDQLHEIIPPDSSTCLPPLIVSIASSTVPIPDAWTKHKVPMLRICGFGDSWYWRWGGSLEFFVKGLVQQEREESGGTKSVS